MKILRIALLVLLATSIYATTLIPVVVPLTKDNKKVKVEDTIYTTLWQYATGGTNFIYNDDKSKVVFLMYVPDIYLTPVAIKLDELNIKVLKDSEKKDYKYYDELKQQKENDKSLTQVPSYSTTITPTATASPSSTRTPIVTRTPTYTITTTPTRYNTPIHTPTATVTRTVTL